MDLKRVLSFPPYPGDYLHPVVYACTAVMLLCLLISILTYVVQNRVIRISKSGWHTLINFLFHTGLTFGVFAAGINQISYPFMCQIVGIVLHYATLSTMFWLMFTARDICKDVSKSPPQVQDRNLPPKTETRQSILRFYLIGYGIPLIVVCVTAAFRMENYGSREGALYCWMAWKPSLAGFYGPVAMLILLKCIYFLCTYINLRRHPERKYELRIMSEEQQGLASNESSHNCYSESVVDSANTGISVVANEQSYKAQLRATAFTLFLFLATWAFGALAISQGHFLDMIFSCLYGAFSVTLGLFLLIQHCAKRDDVWHRWWACCRSSSKTENRNGNGLVERQDLHPPPPHCHLDSPCSGKEPLLSPHLLHAPSTHYKSPPPPVPLSPAPSRPGQCCSTMMSPAPDISISTLAEAAPSSSPQLLSNELPRPSLPLHSCLKDRTKSRSFNRMRPCLQDYHYHKTSTSMDSSMHSSMHSPHLDSPHGGHHLGSSSDFQLGCLSPHFDRQLASCRSLNRQSSCHCIQEPANSSHSLVHSVHDDDLSCHSMNLSSHEGHARQWHKSGTAKAGFSVTKKDPLTMQCLQDPDTYSCSSKMADQDKDGVLYSEVEETAFPMSTPPRVLATLSRRSTISRNSSLQEDYLFSSTGNIRTGPWKNETTV